MAARIRAHMAGMARCMGSDSPGLTSDGMPATWATNTLMSTRVSSRNLLEQVDAGELVQREVAALLGLDLVDVDLADSPRVSSPGSR